MENARKVGFAAPVFGLAAGLLVYMLWGELSAVPMAFALCTLAAFIYDRYGRQWGFLPVGVSAVAALIMHDGFLCGCARTADRIAYLWSYRSDTLYRPFENASDDASLVMLAVSGIFCVIYSALGIRGFAAFAAALSLLFGIMLGADGLSLCLIIGLCIGIMLFGAGDKKTALLALCTAALALPAVFIVLPDLPLHGEVTASGGQPLYLAKEIERPRLSEEKLAYCSGIYNALYEQGFFPQQQTAYLLEATGEQPATEELTVGGGLVPQGVCECEPDTDSFGGCTSDKFTVYRQLPEDIFTLIPKLKDGDYMDCEGLYREYVYSCYGTLTADEAERMQSVSHIDGSLPVDRKLEAVRSGVSSAIKDGSNEEYTELTVSLARSCGIAAREVWGVYFPTFPDSGRADLSEGIYRSWAEVYVDGAGWITLETSPEYEGFSPILPKGADDTAEINATPNEEQLIYKVSPPRTAAEIVPEHEEKVPDKRPLIYTAVFLMAALMTVVIVGRVRAAVRGHRRRVSLSAAHFQGRELLAIALDSGELSPEDMAKLAEEKLGAKAAEIFEASERAYERIRFSEVSDDLRDKAAADRFYNEARTYIRSQSWTKRLGLRIKGLY